MNGIRRGIIGGKVRRLDIAINDVRKIIDPQSFQFLNHDLVCPDFLLGEFYRIKSKREATAQGGDCNSKDEETDHRLNEAESVLRAREGCGGARQKTGAGGCSQELQAILSILATATSAIDAETYISLWE